MSLTEDQAHSPRALVLRPGVVGLAVGALALHAAPAQADIVTYTVDQPLPGIIQFNGVTQFTAGSGTIGTTTAGANLIGEINPGIAAKLVSGTSIGPSQFTTSASSTSLGGAFKTQYYVPLELVTGTGVNFGYGEFDGDAGSGQSVTVSDLVGYAFQTTPNIPITAVDLTPQAPVPEPASLSLLAMGAVGIAAIRRRAR